MDLPYSQHHFARRKQRSAGNLEHLSLAPLTTRLPLQDTPVFDISDYPSPVTSYLQGRSAPVTPRLLSTSPPPLGQADTSLSHSRTMSGAKNGRKRMTRSSAAAGNGSGIAGSAGSAGRVALPKSRSTTHLLGPRRHLLRHGQRRPSTYGEEEEGEDNGEATDEWLFRAGALVTNETREFKGQSWLTARASSTSLAGLQGLTEADGDKTVPERERERRRRAADKATSSSVYGSRRGSAEQLQHLLHQQQLLAANGFSSRASSLMGSRRHSGTGSRARSRVGSQMQLHLPRESRGSTGSGGGILGNGCVDDDDEDGDDAEYDLGEEGAPDFVHLDKKLEALQLHGTLSQADEYEDQIRRLVKREKNGGIMGGWFGSVFGWPLFSVQGGDDEEEEDEDDDEESGIEEASGDEEEDEDGEEDGNAERSAEARKKRQAQRDQRARQRARAYFDGIANPPEESVPPPPEADEGTWKDAAWLLSVASKVLF